MYETNIKKSIYWHKLNQILDEIFAESDSLNLSHKDLANLSGLCEKTVYLLDYRLTRYPHLATIMKLAEVVGLEFGLEKIKKQRKAG